MGNFCLCFSSFSCLYNCFCSVFAARLVGDYFRLANCVFSFLYFFVIFVEWQFSFCSSFINSGAVSPKVSMAPPFPVSDYILDIYFLHRHYEHLKLPPDNFGHFFPQNLLDASPKLSEKKFSSSTGNK